MRRSVAAAVLLAAACGGDSGGGGASFETAARSFCADVTESVSKYMARVSERRQAGERYGGTAVVGVISEMVDGLNVFASSDHGSNQHQQFVGLMTLVQYDENLTPVPYLAERFALSEDGTRLRFDLRDDVWWHDGARTTAYDVEFTYLRVTDPDTNFPNASFWDHYVSGPEGVTVVDSFTVEFELEPHSGYMNPWRSMAIMPHHLLATVPAAQLREHPYGTRCPVGNGPFVFQGRSPDAWTFVANPAFPAALGGRPYLDRYVLRTVPDQNTLMSELLAGGIDVYMGPTVEQASRILETEHLQLKTFPFRDYVMVAWNGRRPQLADKRVRRALTLATDRTEILSVLRGGYGTLANATIPPFHWAYSSAIERELAHDPRAARALLDEAGWVDRDGDGVRESADGLPLAISIKYNAGNQERQSIAQVMQAQLGDVGVDVRVEVVEWGTLIEQITTEARDFDGVVLGWVTEFAIDDADLFRSDRIQDPYAWSATNRPEIDEVLDELPTTLDREVRGPLLERYQQLIIDEQPFTFLYYSHRLAGVSRRMRGVDMDVRGEWVSFRDWWIPESGRRYVADQ